MVSPVNAPHVKKLARVVEIVGPAGAGKTTVTRLLSNKFAGSVRFTDFPDVRKISDAPFFIKYCGLLLPSLLSLYQKDSRQLTRREFAWLAILKGWPSLLQSQMEQDQKVIILDQGPVYLFSQMDEFGPGFLRSQRAGIFWQELYHQWASALDVVVWLDAPDETLVNRIRTREDWHIVKDESTLKMYEFLASFREAYEHIFSKLAAQKNGLRIIRYDSGQKKPD